MLFELSLTLSLSGTQRKGFHTRQWGVVVTVTLIHLFYGELPRCCCFYVTMEIAFKIYHRI